jgi:hypothetical protein
MLEIERMQSYEKAVSPKQVKRVGFAEWTLDIERPMGLLIVSN